MNKIRLYMNRANVFALIDIVKLILTLILVLMFISFNARVAQQAADTRAIAASTNGVVKGQADILNAIKKVTDDTRMTAAQQTAIIICMLQVPQPARTTNLQQQCRAQANASTSSSVSGTTNSSIRTNSSSSSSNNTPQSSQSQLNNSPKPSTTPSPSPAPQSNLVLQLLGGTGGLLIVLGKLLGGKP